MKKGLEKYFLVFVIWAMVFSSFGAINMPFTKVSALADEVKIELIQNGSVVETGTNTLTHTRNYVRSSNKTNGDEIIITAPEGVHYLMVQLDKYCGTPKTTGMAEKKQVEGTFKPSNMSSLEYGETLVYLMNNEFRYVIPGTTGTDAGGTTLGGGSWPYDSRAFATSGNTEKVITARVATEEEINAYRNLALNPFDLHGNDNGRTSPNQKGDINVFPHAFANRNTDNKREFEARGAIDGFEFNGSHVGFPYQAWGCGNEKTDSEFSVLFGRYVEIDQIDITVRAQWNPPQGNNANDHDINWKSATLEFSDGTEMPITLEKLASPQTFKLPEKKIVSWVRVKDLPVSDEIIPVDGRKKFSALTEFKVWGNETDNTNIAMPSSESIVNLAKKVNDYWIKTGGNTGSDATNYNHGHSVGSEFWAPSVFYTGNMEAYYLTGDENYTDYATRWGSNNVYNGVAWNTKADTGRIGKYFPDNHTSFQTYLDMFSITSNTGFDPNDEKIKNLVPIMNEMEQMDINDLKTKNGYWDRIDFFYMELSNWTKMYLLTGEDKWLDKLRALYDDRKAELYDEETGLFYRDKNYIFDPNATYNPDGDGNNQKISPNGKKILWSRGNGWAMGALARVLQDLPDNRKGDKVEYETVFKKMAATLIQVQGDDGFWRMNLDDYDHDPRAETSGTVFFAYGLAWGINNGLLDKETYYPAVKKAFLGLNANAIRPDGLVGRSELISAYPNPKCSLGIGSSQSYAPAAAVLFLSELSKLVANGYVTDDVEPALNKRMIGAVALKEDSKYVVVNSQVKELIAKTIKENDKSYVPASFVKEVYGIEAINPVDKNGITYVSLEEVLALNSNYKLSTLDNGIIVISYKDKLFNDVIDAKLINLLAQGLITGKYPTRPEYPIRFDYTEPPEQLEPSKDALVATIANSTGGVSVNREIGPSSDDEINVEFEMVTVLSPSQTNAIVGIGSSASNYTAYSQVPIIIRMYKDGSFGAYDGTKYVQSSLKFTQNEKYHVRVIINTVDKKYSVIITTPDGKDVAIADNFAYRATAVTPSDIGKIYLFNNDQPEGKYWLEDIYLGEHIDKLRPSKDALVSIESSLSGAISANREIGPSTTNAIKVEFDMVTVLPASKTNAIVGIGESSSNYGAYGQFPIVIRMYKDGKFGAYNGTGFVQSTLQFTENTKYHLRIIIDLAAKKYSVYVITPEQKEVQIADNYSFRATADVPSDIGKIYLINNDQEAGKYWLEDIRLDNYVAELTPSKDALVSVESSFSGAISASRKIGPSTSNKVNVEYDMITSLPANKTNAIVGIGNSDSNYTAYSQIPMIIRMFNDGTMGVYNGNKYVQSSVKFETNIKYHLRVAANLTTKTYNVYISAPEQEEVQIANNFAFRATAKAINDIGKIYLFNNDQEAGKYWLEAITLTSLVDKDALNTEISKAEELNEADYTAVSWSVFAAILKDAKDLAANENATQEAVNTMLAALTTAMDNLVAVTVESTDKTFLQEVVNYAEGISEAELDQVIPVVVDIFKNYLADAKAVLADNNVTQTEVDQAADDLLFVISYLQFTKGDKTALQTLVNEVEAMDKDIYTNASWAEVETALQIAKDVIKDENAMQIEVDQAVADLQKAVNNLVINEDVDKTLLQFAVDYANSITKEQLDQVIPVVVEEFKAALVNGEDVLTNDCVTQKQVDEAFERLVNAIHMLSFIKGDKVALQQLVEQVKGMNPADYTDETWINVSDALNKAKSVLADENAMQEEVDEAYNALQKALNQLEKAVDKTLLETFYNKVKGTDSTKYSESTWHKFAEALNNTKDILASEEAKQAEVDNAYTQLVKAYMSLRLVPNKEALKDMLSKAKALNGPALANVINKTEAVYNNPKATQAEVDNATKVLSEAISGLVKSGNKAPSVATGDTVNMLIPLAGLLMAGYVLTRRKED